MKYIKSFVVMLITITMLLGSSICAFAGEATLVDEKSGVSVQGVFPNSDNMLDVVVSEKLEGSIYEKSVEITISSVLYYDDGGDVDTYDRDDGVTISIPFEKPSMYVVGFDEANNPIDMKAKYIDSKYVFSSDNSDIGLYWITSINPADKSSDEYVFSKLVDYNTGIIVRGYYPKDSYLVVDSVNDEYILPEQPQYCPDFWDIKVYNAFKEVSPKGTIEISIPSEDPKRTVRFKNTNELTDEENNPDINYFDRAWYDTQAEFVDGSFVLYASNTGVFVVATDEFYDDIGGGEKRITPKTEKLEPFNEPASSNGIIWLIIVVSLVAVAIIAVVVIKKKNKRVMD